LFRTTIPATGPSFGERVVVGVEVDCPDLLADGVDRRKAQSLVDGLDSIRREEPRLVDQPHVVAQERRDPVPVVVDPVADGRDADEDDGFDVVDGHPEGIPVDPFPQVPNRRLEGRRNVGGAEDALAVAHLQDAGLL